MVCLHTCNNHIPCTNNKVWVYNDPLAMATPNILMDNRECHNRDLGQDSWSPNVLRSYLRQSKKNGVKLW